MRLLTPDYMFDVYNEITPPFLKSIGVRALLVDIDNTLAPYEQPIPDKNHFEWFAALENAGISVSLISNNNKERVELFNRDLRLPAYPDCKKPNRKYLLRAMKKMNSTPDTTAILGDQLLTDCFAGKRLGMKALIVLPIKDKKTLFFRFKRMIEKPIIRKFKAKEAANGKTKSRRHRR